MVDEYEGHWLTTYSGLKFHFLEPKEGEIDIRDIAHALSLTCRFLGQCKSFYSVAEHSLRVATIVPEESKLLALLHDASEAYITDLPRPLKFALPGYRNIEENLLRAIWRKYVGIWEEADEVVVKAADNILIATEARDLMDNTKDWQELPDPLKERIVPYSKPDTVEWMFLSKFREYCKDWRKY